MTWRHQGDNSYRVDVMDLTLTERVYVNHIFESINVPIPLECVIDLFDFEGTNIYFFIVLYWLSCDLIFFMQCFTERTLMEFLRSPPETHRKGLCSGLHNGPHNYE